MDAILIILTITIGIVFCLSFIARLSYLYTFKYKKEKSKK